MLDCLPAASARNPRSTKARGLVSISFVVKSVAGRAGEQDRRLLKFVGAWSGHDALVPITCLRAPVPIVEQEQRHGQICR